MRRWRLSGRWSRPTSPSRRPGPSTKISTPSTAGSIPRRRRPCTGCPRSLRGSPQEDKFPDEETRPCEIDLSIEGGRGEERKDEGTCGGVRRTGPGRDQGNGGSRAGPWRGRGAHRVLRGEPGNGTLGADRQV